MAVTLSQLGGAAAQFFDDSGVPLAGGKLYTYYAGTTAPATTYQSAAGTTEHPNPILFNAAGRVDSGEIWLTSGTYKFILATSTNVTIATYDNVFAVGNTDLIFNFTGNGIQTVFTLPLSPLSENSTQIYINGVYQNKDTYSVTAAVITFSEAPPVTSKIEVMYN
jgi:hypothetical protein